MKKDGYPFSFTAKACERCPGRCCTGESGYIWVKIAELEAIAEKLKIPFSRVVKQYTYRENGRFSIKEVQRKEEGDFACIFFKQGCQIYDVRPSQCRTYPFWKRFQKYPEEVAEECIGIKLNK